MDNPPFDPTEVTITDTPSDDPITPDLDAPETEPLTDEAKPFRVLSGGKAPKLLPKPRVGSLQPQLRKFYGAIGTAVAVFDPECGKAILQNTEQCAEALEDLAREDPRVRKILMEAAELGTWGKLISAHLPIVMAMAYHHTPLRHLKLDVPNLGGPSANGHRHG